MNSEHSIARGDLFLQSKRADESITFEDGWALFYYNTPKRGKCLSVEFNDNNYPSVTVCIQANWKARRTARKMKKEPGAVEETF